MDYEISNNMFKDASIFSFLSVEQSDILASGYSFKEMDICKKKAEVMELKCINLQKEIFA